MEIFGKRLRERARNLGLTDVEVARRANLSERRYANYVAGSREPAFTTLLKICSVLETDPNYLLGHKGSKLAGRDRPAAAVSSAVSALTDEDLVLAADILQALLKHRRKRPRSPG